VIVEIKSRSIQLTKTYRDVIIADRIDEAFFPLKGPSAVSRTFSLAAWRGQLKLDFALLHDLPFMIVFLGISKYCALLPTL
jgi:hypothetical protein